MAPIWAKEGGAKRRHIEPEKDPSPDQKGGMAFFPPLTVYIRTFGGGGGGEAHA